MKKSILISIIALSAILVHAQDGKGKFSSAIGSGLKRNYNDMLYPYEFTGLGYRLNFEWQTINANNWLSGMSVSLHYASIYASNAALQVKNINANQYFLKANIQYQSSKKSIRCPLKTFRYLPVEILICKQAIRLFMTSQQPIHFPLLIFRWDYR
jgi:hypothetical protein